MSPTVFIRGGSDCDYDEFRFAEVSVLSRLKCEPGTYDEYLAFVQH